MMADETLNKKMADQIPVIVNAARERFTDQIEEYLKGKKIGIKEVDKRRIEQLFTDAVHTYIVAELAAITSYSIYGTLKNDEILTKIVPALLDQIESNLGPIPDIMTKKTGDLPTCAKKVIESKKEKPAIVASLLKDISEMPKMKHLRVSFDGTLLNFMGE
jgi:hypothetical protein